MHASALQLGLGAFTAVSAVTGLASYATFVPGSRIWGRVISHGVESNPARVALTFDDGPTAGATDHVLDQLAELNVKAAFFVIGRNVEREPDLLRRIVAEGHLVGNHTYDHSRWAATGRSDYWRRQVIKADDAIQKVLGERPRLFRPPIGHKTPHTMIAARESGHPVVTWSVRAWDGVPTTPGRILKHVLPRCRAGSIVVLHDGIEPGGSRDSSATLQTIRPLVEGLRRRGLEPVRLDELIRPWL